MVTLSFHHKNQNKSTFYRWLLKINSGAKGKNLSALDRNYGSAKITLGTYTPTYGIGINPASI
jgi:hypothetical protein